MLTIKDLAVSFRTRRGTVNAVRGISLEVEKGRTLGIVGESGSGKSVTSYALMRILDAGGTIAAGEIAYDGMDLRRAAERDMQDVRGREISMIFQNPRAALNPIRKVGHQIEDVLLHHAQATRQTARAKAIAALEAVKIRDAEARYDAYPFELSGGMCQRVVIAIALACKPRLLIADEPTTGLDITTQKAVMDLLRELIRERGMGLILITHDLGLAAEYCDEIAVMKDGEIVEEGAPARLFTEPQHPYTRRLVDATPRLGTDVRSLLPPEDRSPAPKLT
nr:ABC transporter ATP-binding protein [Gammaproteobacteria bacterium]